MAGLLRGLRAAVFPGANSESKDTGTTVTGVLPGETNLDLVTVGSRDYQVLDEKRVYVSEHAQPLGGGAGSFGKVYPGIYHHPLRDIQCAVKIFFNEKVRKEAIEREYALGKSDQESHPKIVDVYGLWYGYPAKLGQSSSEKLPALVMEICETNLRDFLSKKKKRGEVTFFKFETKLRILMDVTDAMLYLHQKGIVHGDLSAVNVLLMNTATEEKNLLAKVTDFGQARELDRTKGRHYTSTCGNVDIMPPEITKRGDRQIFLTVYTDVFSFGCLVGFVAFCVYPEPQPGTCEFKKRDHCLEGMKAPERQKLEPLMKRCLCDEEADRDTFTAIHKYLRLSLSKESSHSSKETIDEEEDMYNVQVLAAKLQEFQRMFETQKVDYERVCNSYQNLEKEKASVDRKIQVLQKEKEDLQTQHQHLKEENTQNSSKIDSLESQLESQKNERWSMNESFKSFDKVVQERLKVQDDLRDTKEQLKKVSAEKEDLDEMYRRKGDQLSRQQKELGEAQQGSRALEVKLKKLQEDFDSLKVQKTSAEDQVKKLETFLKKTTKDKSSQKKELDLSEKEREKMTETVKRMTKKAKERDDELGICKNELADLQRRFSTVQNERDGRQRELETKTASEQQALEKLAESKKICRGLEEQNKTLTAEVKKKKGEITRLNQQIQANEQETYTLKSGKSTMTARATEAENKCRKLESTLKQTEGQVQTLQQSEKRLKAKLSDVEKERDNFYEDRCRLVDEVATLRDKTSKQQKELGFLENLYKEKVDLCAKLQKELESTQQGGEDLYKETQEELTKLKTDLHESEDACNRKEIELTKEKQRVEELDQEVKALKDKTSEKDEQMQGLEKTVNRVKVMLKDLWTHVMPSGTDGGSESTQFENDEEKLYALIKGEYTELISKRDDAVTLKRLAERDRKKLMDDLEVSEDALVKYKEEYQGKLVKLLKLLAEHGPDMKDVVRETRSMLDYIRSQLVVAEETIRRDMTLIAKEAERKVTLLRKSCEEKEDSELKLTVECSKLKDQLASLKLQLVECHSEIKKLTEKLEEEKQSMERKVVEEECKSKEVLTENTVLKSRNDQLVLEKEMVRQDKRELEIQLLQKKEELSKLAKWKGMEEELLSRQDELERRETTLSIREEAINESQSSLTNAVIRKQIHKAYRDCLEHLVHESFKSFELLSSSDEDVDGTSPSTGDGEGLIRKLVHCNVTLQEESSQHKHKCAELERDLKHYKHLAKNCSPIKTKSWEPPTDDVERLKQRLSSLQSAYFDSHRYPCVLYELRSQQLHHPFQCVDGLSGEKLCFNVLLSDLTLLREAKKTFEVFKNENKLAPLIVDSRKSLEERRDSCVSAIFLHFKRMTFYRLHIMHTSKLLTHDAALHEDGVGYAIPQGYIACAQATIHKSDLIKYKITPDNQGRLDYTRKTRFEQPTPLSNPYLQAVASYLDRRIVEHLEDCYNKYGRPSMVMSVPPCGVP